MAGDPGEHGRRHVLARKAIHHARGGVDPGVRGGGGRSEHHEVHDGRSRHEPDQIEHAHKWGMFGIYLIPWGDGHDGRERHHVEQEHAHGNGVNGPRQRDLGVLGFSGRGAHQFDAHECENRELETADETAKARGEQASMVPQVGDRGVRSVVLEAGEDEE